MKLFIEAFKESTLLMYVAIVATLLLGAGLILSAPCKGEAPRCLFQGDWNCQGEHQWNGQQMPSWNLPGVYGGRTSNPVLCDPSSLQCRQVAPGR